MSDKLERLLTPKEVADYLGVTTKTVSEWKRAGYGPRRLYVGRKVFFAASEVARWVSEQDRPPPAFTSSVDTSGGGQ